MTVPLTHDDGFEHHDDFEIASQTGFRGQKTATILARGVHAPFFLDRRFSAQLQSTTISS